MGLEWDPEGDRERSKEGRARVWLTIAIVVGILAFAAKQIVQWQLNKQREEILRGPIDRGY